MDPNSDSFLQGSAYWLEHPWTGEVDFKLIALILALFLIAIFFMHDGIQTSREVLEVIVP